ncbi:MAG TPA: ATP-dependent DNA helicase [Nitrososphaeraceae archaeon]|nr:ATP-dependent DNA helicase [Nitrososphaeraceae archaeon]
MSNNNSSRPLTTADLIKNFPFTTQRNNQERVLNEICAAFNSGYKYIILEAPTGFGKSPVAIAVAMTLGSSYICTATKDLQSQYSKDFPYFKVAKGKNNFPCLVKEDVIRNGTYRCGSCGTGEYMSECYHTTVEYGPCMTDESFKGSDCKYRTFAKDYKIINKGIKEEQIFIDDNSKHRYEKSYSEWPHLKSLKDADPWRPCEYFDQLNRALASSHSIFNYSIFLGLLPNAKSLPERELLVLDEGHLLETEIVKFRGLTISKRRWKRYIQDLKIIDFGYEDIEKWVEFLIELETTMLTLTGNSSLAESLSIERKTKYNWRGASKDSKSLSSSSSEDRRNKNKSLVSASDLFDSDEEIAEKYHYYNNQGSSFSRKSSSFPNLGDELAIDAIRDTERLTKTINNILSNPKNWIVSEIKKENYEVVKVELKPLDISSYCNALFEKCSKTLIMSATILNHKTFCRSIGLIPPEEKGQKDNNNNKVKFIQVQSDFPIEKRPIYPLNIAYLNFNNLQLQEVKSSIAKTIDNLMSLHKNDKGIIHTTSYDQLNFIKENLSTTNARRLIVTDPEIQRDEIIKQHTYNPIKPTVLISPSLHTGLDLKDELSRFQIITKVPYPNKSDRWTNAKRELDEEWYYWQTALKLIQGYGRSVRSKDDWAKTYILDSAFSYFVRKNRSLLPDWFIQAIRGR